MILKCTFFGSESYYIHSQIQCRKKNNQGRVIVIQLVKRSVGKKIRKYEEMFEGTIRTTKPQEKLVVVLLCEKSGFTKNRWQIHTFYKQTQYLLTLKQNRKMLGKQSYTKLISAIFFLPFFLVIYNNNCTLTIVFFVCDNIFKRDILVKPY